MLPDIEGIEVGRRLREQGFKTAVLFLTAKDATENKVEALRAGGDDYVTKPFSLAEIVARIQAILRRTAGVLPGDVLRFADLVLDERRHEVFRGETPVALTATEFSLLRYFMLNPRRVLSKGQILQNVWRYDFGGNSNVVETYVSYLRKKLDAAGPPLIKTVRQAGYMLEVARALDAARACRSGAARRSAWSCSRSSGLAAADVATYTSLRSFLVQRVDNTLESDHHSFEQRRPRRAGRLRRRPRRRRSSSDVRAVRARHDGTTIIARTQPIRSLRRRRRAAQPSLPGDDLDERREGLATAARTSSAYFTVPRDDGGDRFRVRAAFEGGDRARC